MDVWQAISYSTLFVTVDCIKGEKDEVLALVCVFKFCLAMSCSFMYIRTRHYIGRDCRDDRNYCFLVTLHIAMNLPAVGEKLVFFRFFMIWILAEQLRL